jgi:hypothetical protein
VFERLKAVVEQGPDDQFRANAGGIAHGQE